MATLAGAFLAAIGGRLGTEFESYTVRYGAPDDSGLYVENASVITVRYSYETAEVQGNQLGSPEIVSPRVMVSIRRQFSGDSTALAVHQSLLDLAADVRLAIADLVLDHADGTAPISGFDTNLWFTGSATTPATVDIGATGSTESVTIEFTFRYIRNTGAR